MLDPTVGSNEREQKNSETLLRCEVRARAETLVRRKRDTSE